MGIGSLLIKPIQRICRYPLLAKEMLRHVTVSSIKLSLEEALSKLQALANVIDLSGNQMEGSAKLEMIQNSFAEKIQIAASNRYLVKDETLALISGNQKHNRRVLLFNDLVIITRKDWRDKLHLIDKGTIIETRFYDVVADEGN